MITSSKKIIDLIGHTLIRRKQSLALAESVTAGLLQVCISSTENARLFFQGGITTYNLGQKSKLLHINPIEGENCNCVSAITAKEMAQGAAALFGSDWSVSVTGYATPVPESGNRVYCYYAIAYKGKIRRQGRITGKGTTPLEVQVHYTKAVLKAFAGVLN